MDEKLASEIGAEFDCGMVLLCERSVCEGERDTWRRISGRPSSLLLESSDAGMLIKSDSMKVPCLYVLGSMASFLIIKA
jgi:hypothetical protein